MKSLRLRGAWRATRFVLAALLLAGSALFGAASSASAASCSGYTCHGHDPFVYNCGYYTSVSKNVPATGTTLAVLTNWYGHCNANWTQGYLTQAGLNAHDTLYITIDTGDSRGNTEFMCYPGPDNTGQLIEDCAGPRYGGPYTAWTDMVDGTNLTYSVLAIYDRNGNYITDVVAQQ